jgi:hypothetical protein
MCMEVSHVVLFEAKRSSIEPRSPDSPGASTSSKGVRGDAGLSRNNRTPLNDPGTTFMAYVMSINFSALREQRRCTAQSFGTLGYRNHVWHYLCSRVAGSWAVSEFEGTRGPGEDPGRESRYYQASWA